MRRVCTGLRVGLIAVVFITVALVGSAASAVENDGCLGCHENPPASGAAPAFDGPMSADGSPGTPKLMAVEDVDRDSACKTCHSNGLVGTHPYHQRGSNCGAACHPAWGDSLTTAIPAYIDPISGASFASSASKSTPASLLHIIHSTRRWPAGVSTASSVCSSCHEAAACNACHTGVVDASHSGHSQVGSAQFPARGTWTGVVSYGVVAGDQSMRTAVPDTNACSIDECHDLDGTKADYPGQVEDYNYGPGQNPDDPSGSSAAVKTTGTWRLRANNLYTGSRMSFAGTLGSEMSVTFDGSRFELVSDKDPYRGLAELELDGSVVATLNAYAPTTQRQAILYSSDRLWPGEHTVKIRPLERKNPEARATFFVVDAVRVFRDVPDSIAPACSGCHSAMGRHPASHEGTDAAIRASNGGKGCSDTPAQYQTGCHDISNLAVLHSGMAAEGCDPCHAPGRTPARECKTCHDDSGVAGYTAKENLYPASDDTQTAGVTAFPATPATRWDKVAETSAAGDADTTYVNLTTPGRATFGFTPPASFPQSSTITNVTVYYRIRYVSGTGTPCNAGAAIRVGGQYYDQPTPTNATTAYVLRNYVFATNPKTGQPWTVAQITDPNDPAGLQAIGVYTSDATPNVRVTQAYAIVTYAVPRYVDTVSTGAAHHNNTRYLLDYRDAEIGAYYYDGTDPEHGWSARQWQDCNAACHQSYVGASWTAYEGQRMWYSLAGQWQSIAETRTLELDAGTLPSSAQLAFKTRWQFLTGNEATGCVEVSVDQGRSWTMLTGTVFGVSRDQLTGNSPASWGDATYDLSAYAGRETRIRFRYNMADTLTNGAGWAIDALSITGSSGLFFSDDAETLKPQWNAWQWYRESAAYQAW